LLNGGIEVMPLKEYPWSKLYGWVQDKYGVNWQLSFNPLEEGKQRLTPTLMFNETNNGRAREAIDFYCSVFPNSEVTGILKYKDGEDIEGNIKHAEFNINGYAMMAMDTSSTYTSVFNEGISMVVLCDTQEEIDHYWKALARDGQESQCGWLKDKYQLSWQIVPTILDKLLKDSSRSKSVIEVFLKMKKFDIEKLLNA
jgi:predicted 3-demethylubiquinone-9 3-methyltransferase (glyoxalase superfamily)